jgi:hypothetical protein
MTRFKSNATPACPPESDGLSSGWVTGHQPRSLGEINPKPFLPALVAAGQFGTGGAEVLLEVALVNFTAVA